MSKKGNLSAALSQFDKRPAAPQKDEAAPEAAQKIDPPTIKTSPVQKPVEQGRAQRPPSRQGKKALTGYFDPVVLKQLKVMALEQDKTNQALLAEALNDLFKKYGKPHIA